LRYDEISASVNLLFEKVDVMWFVWISGDAYSEKGSKLGSYKLYEIYGKLEFTAGVSVWDRVPTEDKKRPYAIIFATS
jgi:hypothetical protein